MKYSTLATCPVCGAMFEQIQHDEPEINGVVAAMMIQPERDEHRLKSPECTKDVRWMKGWNLERHEL